MGKCSVSGKQSMRVAFCIGIMLVGLAGCASHSGVVPNGQGGYLIAKQAATGFPGLGNLKAEVLDEASQYCGQQGREFLLVKSRETQSPYMLGNYPRAEIEFQCSPQGGKR
jgi:putative hemolysin